MKGCKRDEGGRKGEEVGGGNDRSKQTCNAKVGE